MDFGLLSIFVTAMVGGAGVAIGYLIVAMIIAIIQG